MKVMVTGGTGFVGSHTVAELLRKGHDVRLLVRDVERVSPALEPLGVGEVDTVIGDVTDRQSVERAARGCDATIHCGSVYSLDPRAAGRIKRTNVLGTDTVLKTACELGHDPIVHVSSIVALIGNKGATLTPDSIPGNPPGAYFISKADSDRVARKYQDSGAPVVITYPGSVWGPHDPHLGESCQMTGSILRHYWTIIPKGIISITDVRDLAVLHERVMEKGRGSRRYIAPATNMTVDKVVNTVASLTGRTLPAVVMPPWMLLGPMQVFDWLQRFLTFRLPVNYQAVYCVGLNHIFDDSGTRDEYGIVPRTIEDTLADTITWMVGSGHMLRKLAGRLAR
jgi:dihydroflavonol-4-reductase